MLATRWRVTVSKMNLSNNIPVQPASVRGAVGFDDIGFADDTDQTCLPRLYVGFGDTNVCSIVLNDVCTSLGTAS